MNTQRPLVLSVLAVGLLTLTGCATFVKEGATDAEK